MYAKELEKLHAENVRENENIKHLEQEKNRLIEDQINQQNQEKVIIMSHIVINQKWDNKYKKLWQKPASSH